MIQAISRSKVELFLGCPRCFWLDVRARLRRPSGPPFTLNTAVDHLLKNEFDRYRVRRCVAAARCYVIDAPYAIDAA